MAFTDTPSDYTFLVAQTLIELENSQEVKHGTEKDLMYFYITDVATNRNSYVTKFSVDYLG